MTHKCPDCKMRDVSSGSILCEHCWEFVKQQYGADTYNTRKMMNNFLKEIEENGGL